MRKIHLIFILDRSGSMSGLEEDTIGGYNAFLKKYADYSNTTVSTVLFDHDFTLLYDEVHPKSAILCRENYTVRGATALLDAIGNTVKLAHNKRHFIKEETKRIYIITTDGMENASEHYTYQNIHRLISEEQEYGHEFVFLGANIDIYKEAHKLGIKREFARSYSASKKGTRKMYNQMNTMVDCAINKE